MTPHNTPSAAHDDLVQLLLDPKTCVDLSDWAIRARPHACELAQHLQSIHHTLQGDVTRHLPGYTQLLRALTAHWDEPHRTSAWPDGPRLVDSLGAQQDGNPGHVHAMMEAWCAGASATRLAQAPVMVNKVISKCLMHFSLAAAPAGQAQCALLTWMSQSPSYAQLVASTQPTLSDDTMLAIILTATSVHPRGLFAKNAPILADVFARTHPSTQGTVNAIARLHDEPDVFPDVCAILPASAALGKNLAPFLKPIWHKWAAIYQAVDIAQNLQHRPSSAPVRKM